MKPSTNTSDLQAHKHFAEIHERIRNATVTSVERQFALFQAVQYIVKAKIPGALVECGVAGGGSSALMAMALEHLKVSDRWLWLYDTFSGMTDPTAHDKDYRNLPVKKLLEMKGHAKPSDLSNHSLASVKAVMAKTKYSTDKIMYVQGDVMQTIPARVPSSIALLRLDTDWYESTAHELAHLYPLLMPGGVLIIDDYGHWQGCKKAVDEFFKDKSILLNRIDYTGRIAIKLA